MPFDINAIQATAQQQYADGVTKELTKKLKVIALRQSQIDAFVARWNKRVAEFNAAVAAATTPAQITEVLEAYKFPASSIHFTPVQKWASRSGEASEVACED